MSTVEEAFVTGMKKSKKEKKTKRFLPVSKSKRWIWFYSPKLEKAKSKTGQNEYIQSYLISLHSMNLVLLLFIAGVKFLIPGNRKDVIFFIWSTDKSFLLVKMGVHAS